MALTLDWDLVSFFATLAKILFRSPARLKRNARPLPIRCDYQEARTLTPEQERCFAPYDTQLEAMNYRPASTYRVANMGHNLVRVYINPADVAQCLVMVVEVAVKAGQVRGVNHSQTIVFTTRFADGTVLTTRNMKLKSLMDEPPYRVLQECPALSEPAKLKRRHDARAAKLGGCPVSPAADPASMFRQFQSDHDRFLSYQVERGVCELDKTRNAYVLSSKAHWRGIRNFLNPFAHRFSLLRFLPAAITAMVLPVVAFQVAPNFSLAAQKTGFPGAVAAQLAIGTSYLVAGAILGYMLERHTFIWVFLLTYVAVHFAAGIYPGNFPYSAWAGIVSYYTAQAKKRRKLVLLPRTDEPTVSTLQ